MEIALLKAQINDIQRYESAVDAAGTLQKKGFYRRAADAWRNAAKHALSESDFESCIYHAKHCVVKGRYSGKPE